MSSNNTFYQTAQKNSSTAEIQNGYFLSIDKQTGLLGAENKWTDQGERQVVRFLEGYFWNCLQEILSDQSQAEYQDGKILWENQKTVLEQQQESQKYQEEKEYIQQLENVLNEQKQEREDLNDFRSLEYKLLLDEKQALERQLQAKNEEIQKFGVHCDELEAHCVRYRTQRNQFAENLQQAEAKMGSKGNSKWVCGVVSKEFL
eukprot:TRINITY_DN18619_c0_g1_i4.p1 TRINITY_DN18619_c0_g1~~TRINITY_DN18619_c0_g1_i4.p1  ORF type:complete len:203 (+),score=35.26 TRINITY_DN18619_c0_g1_i4:139-747(+)